MIADARPREEALDPRRSFIVQAPAGSGKTELLVRRYIALLKTVQKPEEIVAITFTIKAAAEMRKRVLQEIDSSEVAHRLRIQTIDAFCASLTRQMPVVSGFGAQPGVVEDAREHYVEASKRTISELSAAACRLLLHLDNNTESATSLIASMLAKRDQWLRKTGSAPTRAELEANLVSERARILAYARTLHPKASVEFAAASLTKSDHKWRKQGNPVPPARQIEPLREALEALLRMPDERYTDDQWQLLGAIMELLPRAAAWLKVVFAERGETDFTEVAQGAVRALGSADHPTDLMLAMDTRIRHLLVDEFQDTSYSQFELIEKLTAGWERGDGRTLFLVGDPMQSIYRFREAKVALFLQAWERGIGTVRLERLTLTTNWRSQAGLVNWFNSTFPSVLPRAADPASGAVPYSPATANPDNKAIPGAAATWHHVPDREQEAARIVNLVTKAEGRAAILVRSRLALADIVPALKGAGIRYRAIEIEHLGEKQVVQDLYALTRALLHPADRIAWLSVLRAPWLGLSINQLHQVASRDRFKTIWELIKDDLFLSGFTRLLAPAVANRERGSLRDRVEGAWLALGGPACVADKTELEDAERYLDELEKLEEQGPVADLSRLRVALERLFALPDVDATDDDLQIMTVHKAKGLEFGTVIVPGLDLGPGGGEPDLLLFHELTEGLLLAPIKATGAETDPTYRYLRDLDAEAEDVESSRLLYVAATRAEDRLHLLACLGCDKDGELKKPPARSLLSRAWPVAQGSFEPQPSAATAEAAGQPNTSVNRLSRAFRAPALPDPVRWSAPQEGREEQEIEFSWAGETARHVGTIVHRWLQRIADAEMRGWDAKRVDALRSMFARELERRGVQRSHSKAAADLVGDTLKNALEDERGRWLLGAHPEAHTEHRLRVRTAQGMRSYVIDRLFKDKSGERWIVDFKTSRHEGGGTEVFLDEQRTRYESQLNAYASAFDGSRVGLYFPLLRGWRQWES